ncbi:Aorsin [Lachnellula subtilissima]|uniref:Aorsin n=1 Tax=Lachnellula subtilissima TaxID=602034 RepID=A0A8H8RBM0_9HELO|nr:Aorsin [Lachnellula subtilissima]
MDVSHPEAKNYAKHWTPEEIVDMFAPAQKTIDTVKEWLTDFGIDAKRITNPDNKGWLAFDDTTSEAEALLHAKYHYYEHVEGYVTPACESYHVPRDIHEHVDYITPGVKLFTPSKRGHGKRHIGISSSQGSTTIAPLRVSYPPDFNITAAGELATCEQFITPACIRALYEVPEIPEYSNGKPRSDKSLGIFESGDFYKQADLDLHFSNFTPRIPTGTHPTLASIDGGQAPVHTDDWLNTVGGGGAMGGFNTFLDALDGASGLLCHTVHTRRSESRGMIQGLIHHIQILLAQKNTTYQGQLQCGVHKYGANDSDSRQTLFLSRMVDKKFMKLGLQGVSIFYASRDSGVSGRPWDTDESGCIGANYTAFSPAWPNSCPYLTSVGATKVYPGKTVKDSESAAYDPAGQPYWNKFASGGGFSNLYPIPDYQQDVVAHFYKNHNPKYPYYTTGVVGQDGGLYNRSGRGYPDVAANGDNIAIFFDGFFERDGGTSASMPIFASIVNRINEQRLNAGKNVIGFNNPALYANPSMLNDITNGSNPSCGTDGFQAVPGWDPVTGLGTPNYPKRAAYFMSLP